MNINWYIERQKNLPDPRATSPNYFEVENMSLYVIDTNSDFCIIDALVCNPNTTKDERNIAYDKILLDVEKYAHSKGYLRIWGFPYYEGSKKKALEFGYEKMNDELFIKRIKE